MINLDLTTAICFLDCAVVGTEIHGTRDPSNGYSFAFAVPAVRLAADFSFTMEIDLSVGSTRVEPESQLGLSDDDFNNSNQYWIADPQYYANATSQATYSFDVTPTTAASGIASNETYVVWWIHHSPYVDSRVVAMRVSALPDAWGDWVDLDLGNAVFFTNGTSLANGVPWGRYDTGHIVTNIGWPDFYFPSLVLDRSASYQFEITYDPGPGLNGRGMWLSALADADPAAMYYAFTSDFGDIARSEGGESRDVYTLEVRPGDWDTIASDRNTPYFESDRYGALLRIRYRTTGSAASPVAPPPARAHFWGQ